MKLKQNVFWIALGVILRVLSEGDTILNWFARINNNNPTMSEMSFQINWFEFIVQTVICFALAYLIVYVRQLQKELKDEIQAQRVLAHYVNNYRSLQIYGNQYLKGDPEQYAKDWWRKAMEEIRYVKKQIEDTNPEVKIGELKKYIVEYYNLHEDDWKEITNT